jgi:AmiR/NasT family two-component response regulator
MDDRTSAARTPEADEAMVEQAKGILAVMFALTPDEALVLMQAFAGQEFPSLADLAEHVVSVATEPPGVDVDLVRERLTLLLFADGMTL